MLGGAVDPRRKTVEIPRVRGTVEPLLYCPLPTTARQHLNGDQKVVVPHHRWKLHSSYGKPFPHSWNSLGHLLVVVEG